MGTHSRQIKLALLPFRWVDAFADVESGQIFVSDRFLDDIEENTRHEIAHVVSGDPDHGHSFREQLNVFGGIQPPDDDTFSKIRRRLGIPARIAANIGNISGVSGMLLDYHLLQAYRKFSQKVLGTEGHWEVLNEGGEGPTKQLIRLYPTPKGTFPVVVLYYPVVTHFRSPQARMLANKMLLAQTKIALGHARRKLGNMPSPGGGNLGLDGGDLVTEGLKMEEEITKQAIELGEPLPIQMW